MLCSGPAREILLAQRWIDRAPEPVDAIQKPLQIPGVGLRTMPPASTGQPTCGIGIGELLQYAHRPLPNDSRQFSTEALKRGACGIFEQRDVRPPIALAIRLGKRRLGAHHREGICRDGRG